MNSRQNLFITGIKLLCVILISFLSLRAQGNAITLNGTSQYATLDNVAGDMASSTTNTIEFWFNANSTQTDAGQVSLFAVNSSTGGNRILILLGTSATQDGKIYIYDGSSATDIISGTTSYLDDAPHHLTFVRNGSTGTLYVDGVSQGSGTCGYTFASTDKWSIGTEWDSGPTATDFFKGSIDDIRVWNAVRSIDTIQAHMFSLSATNSNLKGWWKCDEASGTTLSDASGSSNTGALVGSPTFTSSFLPTEPTIAASNITRSNPTTSSMTISWTRGNGDSCIVVVGNGGDGSLPIDGKTYLAFSSWGSGTSSGNYAYVVYKGTGNSVTITNMISPLSNQTYGFAVYEFNSFQKIENYKATNFNTWYETLDPEPTVQASNVSFSSINSTSLTIDWTRGNGDSCIVLLKSGSSVNSDPVDGTPLTSYGSFSYYNASSVFQSGAQIGSGNYVVYNRTGTSVTVTGLTPSTTYHAAVYELNGRADWTNFKAPGAIGNAQTLSGAPTLQASNVSFSSVTATSMTIQWNNGNGSNRLVVVKAGSSIPSSPVDGNVYTPSTVFGSGNTIGTGVYVVYNGTGSSVNITGLSGNTTYYVSVFEFNTVVGTTRYLLPAATGNTVTPTLEPSTQASGVSFSSVSTSSMTINWTSGNGSKRIVLMKAGSSVDSDPVDLTTYNANTIFGSGSQIGTGNYAVYNNTGNSVAVTGLTSGTTYHVAVYEFNGASGLENYRTTSPARSSLYMYYGEVTAVSPTKNSLNVSTNVSVQVTFSEPMLTSTFNDTTSFIITGNTGGRHKGTIVFSGGNTIATFTPDVPFKNGELVFVQLTSALQVSSGGALKPFGFTFKTSVSGSTGTFSEAGYLTTTNYPTSIFVNDIDCDSYGDIVVLTRFPSNIAVFINNGSGEFPSSSDYSLGATSGGDDLFVNDFNGDGYADIAVSHIGYDSLIILLNNGDGTFPTQIKYRTGTDPYHLCVSDLDGDGDRDVVTSNMNSYTISVFKNNGDGTFATKVDYAMGVNSWPEGLDIKDLDGDGDGDIAVSLSGPATVAVLKNNGDGTFATKVPYVTGSDPNALSIGDIDDDGDEDIVIGCSPKTVNIFKNNGDGTFQNKVDYQAVSGIKKISISDLDGDGDADLSLARYAYDSSFSVLLNNSDGSFNQGAAYSPWTQAYSLFITDLNGDGIMDNVLPHYSAPGKINIFLGEVPLPVELTSFSASVKHVNVELHWNTATEVNNHGFEIEKYRIQNTEVSSHNKTEVWKKIGFVEGNGTTNAPKEYSFADKNPPAGKYSYRLKQIDSDGKFKYSQEIEVIIGAAPLKFELAQNYPNPFNPTTKLEFTVPENGLATLKIFNAIGQEVATLFNGEVEAGKYNQVIFIASKLSSGIYLARLQYDGKQLMKKMLLMK